MQITPTPAPTPAPVPTSTPQQARYEKQVRTLAETFVSQAFYMPLLKELRENPFQTDTSKQLSGGRGGEAFGAMLDEHRAKHLAGSTDSGLVDAITRKIVKASTAADHTRLSTQDAIRRLGIRA